MAGGRPPLYTNNEELERIVDLYFLAVRSRITEDESLLEGLSGEERLIVNYVPDFTGPTISGLAYTLGMTTETLRQYEKQDKFSSTIKKAKQLVEAYLEGRLYGPSPVGAIFNLKNNHGWKDKQEQDINHNFKDLPDEELDKRIKALMNEQGAED